MFRLVQAIWDWLLGWSSIPRHLRADVAELREDPIGRLSDAPVVIRRFRAWPLIVLTPVLFYLVVRAEHDLLWPALIVAGITLLYIVVYVWSMPEELRLESDGLLFRRRNVEVVCSWELFAVVGLPFRVRWWLYLPVNPAAVDQVGMWRKGEVVAEGDGVDTAFFRFGAPDQLKLATGLELGPDFLGSLILHVANAMYEPAGSEAEFGALVEEPGPASAAIRTGTKPPERSVRRSVPAAAVDWGGRLRMPCTHLLFPLECCICGTPTASSLRMRAQGRLGILTTRSYVDFNLPCCTPCIRSEVWRSRIAIVLPVLINATAWIALLCMFTGWAWTELRALGIGALLSLLTLGGALALGEWLLLRVRASFLSYDNELELRFRQTAFAARVADYIQSLPTAAVPVVRGNPEFGSEMPTPDVSSS